MDAQRSHTTEYQSRYSYSRSNIGSQDSRFNTSVEPFVSYGPTPYPGFYHVQHSKISSLPASPEPRTPQPPSHLPSPSSTVSTQTSPQPSPRLQSSLQSKPPGDVNEKNTTAEVQLVVVESGKPEDAAQVVYVESEAWQDYDNHSTLACFITFCCCCPLGFWAWRLAQAAEKKKKAGKFSSARKAGRLSIAVSIAGCIIGISLIVVALILRYVVFKEFFETKK